MEKKKKDGLHVNRYKTLKEHRAAVAARKALKGGKNKGPVANAAAYGETIKKIKKATPKATPKVAPKPKTKPKTKPKADGSVKAIPRKTKYTRDVQARDKAEKTARKSNFDGVGPTPSQRKRRSSPAAMKRRDAMNGVGPSNSKRRKDSSAEAMAEYDKKKKK